MQSRLRNLFEWQRVVRIATSVTLVGGTVVGVGTVSLAAASCYTINRIRPRTYTDDYHLNPEILRMPYKTVDFSTEDGVNLKGWWIPATLHGRESNRIVILMNPYDNHKSNFLGVASALWYHGCSVFMFDFRSFASNPHTRQSIGYLEQFDAVAAVNYVKNNHWVDHSADDSDVYKQRQIVLMGASMGGACAICVAPKFPSLVSAIVTDCTFSSLRDIVKYRMSVTSSMWMPTGLLDTVVSIMDIGNQFIYGYSVDDVSPMDVVASDDFDFPLLLLHSECDAAVPFVHSQNIYKKCRSSIKNLYCIKSGDHCAGYFMNPNLYIKYCCQWVDDVLDHEIMERKKNANRMKTTQQEPSAANVVVNNDFIMFDVNDDEIGDEDTEVEQEQEKEKEKERKKEELEPKPTAEVKETTTTRTQNEAEQIIIVGVKTANEIKDTVPDEKPSSSSFLSYFGFHKN